MDLLDALRLLTSLELPHRRATSGPREHLQVRWAEVADTAVFHGLAPLVSYNLEYRLGGAGAPEEIHDQLLGYYHGTLTDNVFKLVHLKRLLCGAEDVEVVLLEAAAYADALYPHVAFRALPELRLLVRRGDFPKLASAGGPLGLRIEGVEGDAVVLTDGRVRFLLHDALFGQRWGAAEEEIWARGAPAKAFGPRVRRPAIEDAILVQVVLMARSAFASPLIEYVDLRELVLGSPAQRGSWDRPPDAAVLKSRAQKQGLSRALWCALQLLIHFFPGAQGGAMVLLPELPAAVRGLLEAGVLLPSRNLDRTRVNRAAEEIRKLLV
ncbi:MAG: nucleotidyltransferase family protein [Deltaproteobacteria bacterium]|nr:nucleotidyltransferase family protein [Deltaproteobacteria bacterium]